MTLASAISAQYRISSDVNRKFRGAASAPALRIPKYMGSHSRQFTIRWITLSPFFTPFAIRAFATRLAIISNSCQVMAALLFFAGSLSIRAILSLYILAFLAKISGIIMYTVPN